mmetsp:Transcript_65002/g.164754  ORF Transcript_65002/g.164754 Transcript_65002/m.164754 type:complete len:296 (+) Transcript_65002:306-1193(+)
MVEHALFEGDHDELRVREVRPDHVADVLGVAQVQCRVDLIQNVHRSGLEQQQCQDQRQGHERALTATQLGQRLLPLAVETDLDLEALGGVHALRRLELGAGVGQQGTEDRVEVLVHLDPSSAQGLQLFLVQVLDHGLDLLLVVQDDVPLLQQVLVLLLGLLEHDHGLLVDVLAKLVLLNRELVQASLVVLVAVGLEIEVRAFLAKEALLLLDPSMLLLHPGDDDVRLLVVLRELLQLVAHPLLFDLLLLPLLLVGGQLRRQVGQGLIQLHHLCPQLLEPGADLGVRGALLLQLFL